MAITLGELKQAVSRVVGDKPDDRYDIEQVINDAGKYLFSMHSWRWRDRPVAPLSYIAPISIANATYTESTKTITKTSGFTSYTFRNAELFEVTDGTSATEAEYAITSRTSANAIVLGQSIGSGADGQTDIDGTINFPYCVLPSDFGDGQIVALAHQNNIVRGVIPASLSYVRWLRYNSVYDSTDLYYSVSYPTQTSTSVVPANPLLEIYPTPTAAENSVLMLTYKSGWVTLEDEDAVANVPSGYEYILKRLVKAFSQEAMSSDNSMIQAIESSIEFLKLKRMDGGTQASLGKIEGGAAMPKRRDYYQWDFSVSDPA